MHQVTLSSGQTVLFRPLRQPTLVQPTELHFVAYPENFRKLNFTIRELAYVEVLSPVKADFYVMIRLLKILKQTDDSLDKLLEHLRQDGQEMIPVHCRFLGEIIPDLSQIQM